MIVGSGRLQSETCKLCNHRACIATSHFPAFIVDARDTVSCIGNALPWPNGPIMPKLFSVMDNGGKVSGGGGG